MVLRKSFRNRIKNLRKSMGLTQEKFAELVDISSVAVSRIESGKSFPSPETIDKFAIALDLDYSELFTFEKSADQDSNIRVGLERYLNTFNNEELAYMLDCARAFAKFKRKKSK